MSEARRAKGGNLRLRMPERREGMSAGRLEVDWTRCDGHGLCHALLPARIAVDEWGFPIIGDPNVAGDDLSAARVAVAACPSLALRLETPAPALR